MRQNVRAACLYLIALLAGLGVGVSGIQNKPLFWSCMAGCFVLVIVATCTLEPVSSRIFRKKRGALSQPPESPRKPLAPKRLNNERPKLVGRITGVSKSPLTGNRCHVLIHVWIRNEGPSGTGVRASVAIKDVQGKPLFISHLHDQSLGLSLQTERLEYGRRVEGFFPFDVETPMANVDAASAAVTLADDFDQVTALTA